MGNCVPALRVCREMHPHGVLSNRLDWPEPQSWPSTDTGETGVLQQEGMVPQMEEGPNKGLGWGTL